MKSLKLLFIALILSFNNTNACNLCHNTTKIVQSYRNADIVVHGTIIETSQLTDTISTNKDPILLIQRLTKVKVVRQYKGENRPDTITIESGLFDCQPYMKAGIDYFIFAQSTAINLTRTDTKIYSKKNHRKLLRLSHKIHTNNTK